MAFLSTRGRGRFLTLFFLCLLLVVKFCYVSGVNVTVFDASSITSSDGDKTTDELTTLELSYGIQMGMSNLNNEYTFKISLQQLNSSQSFADALKSALNKYPTVVAVVGVYGDANLKTALSLLNGTNCIIWSPLVGGVPAAAWNRQVVFTMMSPQDELLYALKFAYVDLHVKRIGFMYLSGVGVGEELYATALSYLTNISAQSMLVSYVEPYSSDFKQDAFNSFSKNVIGATIIQAKPGKHMGDFLNSYMSNDQTAGRPLIGCTFQQMQMVQAVQKYTGSNPPPLYIATSIPPRKGTAYNAPGKVDSLLPKTTDSNFLFNFYGFTAMTSLSYAIQWAPDAATMYTNLFHYFTRFVYDDYVMGFYGPTYDVNIVKQGGFSECNRGGQRVFMQQYSVSGAVSVVSNATNLEAQCSLQGSIPFQTTMGIIQYTDPALAAIYSFSQESQGMSNRVPGMLIGPIDKRSNSISTSHQTNIVTYTNSAFEQESPYVKTNILYGPLDLTVTNVPADTILFDPIYAKPEVNMRRPNEYHIVPTFTQDMVLLCVAASSVLPGSQNVISAIIRADPTQTYLMQEAVMAIAGGMFHYNAYVESVADNETITTKMWNSGVNVLVGMNASEIGNVTAFLKENSGAQVFFPYRQMSLLYSTLKKNIDTSLYPQVFSSSNIPFWSMKVPPLQAEMTTAVDLLRKNPFKFMKYPLTNASYMMRVPSGTISTDNVSVGPFYEKGYVNPSTKQVAQVGRNWGAAQTSFLSGNGFLAPTGTAMVALPPDGNYFMFPDYDPLKPTITSSTTTTSKPLPPHSNSDYDRAHIVLIIFFCVAIILFLVLLGYILATTIFAWVFVKNAPKDGSKSITVIFSDVDFSASLWSELPHLQEWASAEHEQIVRDLIEKYKCYEAYSDGSRFIIVSKDAHKGLLLSCEIHQAILEHEWNSEKFDEWYQLIEEALKMEEYTNYTLELTLEEYEELWGGLRVRVGVHSGLCGIHFQKSTKRYQYYGTTVETALHVEEKVQGGATIATECTWELLTVTQTAGIDHSYLGLIDVRGLAHPIRLYLINAIPGRVFGPLRTPPRYLQADAHSNAKQTECMQIQTSLLSLCYGHFAPDQRVEEILPLAQEWGVKVPAQEDSDEDYCKLLIELIVAQMNYEAEEQARIAEGEGEGEGEGDEEMLENDNGEENNDEAVFPVEEENL